MSKPNRRTILGGLAATLAAPAVAQAPWPNRPVKLIVPYAAGGGTDTLARPWADKLGQAFGQSFVIDNRGGASGTIGAEAAARSSPDGYTFLLTPNSALNVVPQLRKVGYDARKDLLPVGRVGDLVGSFAINARLGIKTMAEMLDYARRNPGKLSYGSAGLGTSTHMRLEIIKLRANVDILHVPYRGAADALNDVLAGNVDMMNDVVIYPHAQAGKLNLLAVSHMRRNPEFPHTPTLTEAGFANADVPIWFAVWAPASTPADIIAALNRKIAEIGATPEMQARTRGISFALPDDFSIVAMQRFFDEDTMANAALIKEAKISLG